MEIFHKIRFKEFLDETKKELAECYKEGKRQTAERTDPLENFSKDLKDSIKKRIGGNKC